MLGKNEWPASEKNKNKKGRMVLSQKKAAEITKYVQTEGVRYIEDTVKCECGWGGYESDMVSSF